MDDSPDSAQPEAQTPAVALDVAALADELMERMNAVPLSVPHGMREESVATARKPSEWARLYFDENPDMLARIGGDIRYEDMVPVISDFAGVHVPKTTIYRTAIKAKRGNE